MLPKKEDNGAYLRDPNLRRDLAAFRRLEVEYAEALMAMARDFAANHRLKIKESKLADGEQSDGYTSSIVIVPEGDVLYVFQPRTNNPKLGAGSSRYQPHPNAFMHPGSGMDIVSDVISGLEKILGV